MSEKKLTDEEIVKDIERSTGMPSYWKKIVLDIIHRLQGDYSNLKERYVKVLGLNEKVIANQKAEIERLTKLYDETNNELFDRNIELEECEQSNKSLQTMNFNLSQDNAELQKQVDELKDELQSKEISIEMSGGHIIKMTVCKWSEMGKIIEDNAVKDTAKEIANWLPTTVNEDKDVLSRIIKEHYGVEVD